MKMFSKSISVAEIHESRDHFIIPDWQRDVVWDIDHKRELIDSVLRGLKLPKLYFAETTTNEFEVVDGQQRVTTLLAFVDGAFTLSPATMRHFGLEKGSFQDLPEHLANALRHFTLESDVLTDATEKEKRDFFQRLQQGLPLAGREKLNAISSGMRDFAYDLTKYPFFSRVALKDMRNAFFDITSKVVAVAVNGLLVSAHYRDMVELYERHRSFSPTSPAAENLKATFGFLERAFPTKTEPLKDRPFIQSVITLASHFVAGGESEGREAEFGEFITAFDHERHQHNPLSASADPEYVTFNNPATSRLLNGYKARHEILLDKMSLSHPHLRALFKPYTDSAPAWVANDPVAESEPEVSHTQTMMVAKKTTLEELSNRRTKLVIPDWRQRSQVWNIERRQMLIDTILEGWKLPKLYLHAHDDKDDVIDGQQRLAAVFDFMDGKLSLSPKTVRKFKLQGAKIIDLPPNMAEAFRHFELEYDVISRATPAGLRDIFRRLQYGMALLGREKLNAVTSNLRDYCKTLSKHEFFQTRLSVRNTRHFFFHIVSRVAAIELEGFDAKWDYGHLKTFFGKHEQFSSVSPAAKHIETALDFLLLAFPKKTPFHDGTFVESLIVLAVVFSQHEESERFAPAFGQFAKEFYTELFRSKKGGHGADRDYLRFGRLTSGNVSSVAKSSHEVLLLKMQQKYPAMAAVLGLAAPIEPSASQPSSSSGSQENTSVTRTAARAAAARLTETPPKADPPGHHRAEERTGKDSNGTTVSKTDIKPAASALTCSTLTPIKMPLLADRDSNPLLALCEDFVDASRKFTPQLSENLERIKGQISKCAQNGGAEQLTWDIPVILSSLLRRGDLAPIGHDLLDLMETVSQTVWNLRGAPGDWGPELRNVLITVAQGKGIGSNRMIGRQIATHQTLSRLKSDAAHLSGIFDEPTASQVMSEDRKLSELPPAAEQQLEIDPKPPSASSSLKSDTGPSSYQQALKPSEAPALLLAPSPRPT